MPVDLGGIEGADGLAICADFEASLATQNWRMTSRFLDEALSSGVMPWLLCNTTLSRLAHNIGAAIAGTRGSMLPLVAADSSNNVTLILDGSLPVNIRTGSEPPVRPFRMPLAGPGMDAWLRVCRPAALWSLAGGAHGFQAANALPAAMSNTANVGDQVVEAIQAALSTRLSEEHIAEVWRALNTAIAQGSLVRRADGTWAAVESGSLML